MYIAAKYNVNTCRWKFAKENICAHTLPGHLISLELNKIITFRNYGKLWAHLPCLYTVSTIITTTTTSTTITTANNNNKLPYLSDSTWNIEHANTVITWSSFLSMGMFHRIKCILVALGGDIEQVIFCSFLKQLGFKLLCPLLTFGVMDYCFMGNTSLI